VIQTIENSASENNWLGLGVGYGANAIARLLTGTQQFLAGEGEFPRVIAEFGAPAGMAFMLFRWLLELMIVAKALSRVREHEPLAWLLVPLTISTLAFGTLEQPTEQGFMVISVALSFAALRIAHVPIESAPAQNLRLRQARHNLRA
jgi:succinate-acetate transporter protein